MCYVRCSIVLYFVFLCSVRPAAGATDLLAEVGQPAPDGISTFSGFGSPYINDTGQVALYASMDTADAILVDNGTAQVEVVRTGEVSPDGNGLFDLLSLSGVNSHGEAIFASHLTSTTHGSSDDDGYFVGDGGPILQLAREGSAAPDGEFSDLTSSPALGAAGRAAFRAGLADTSEGSSSDVGLFTSNAGTFDTIAMEGQSVPDNNGVYSTFSSPAFTESGQAAFWSQLDATTGGSSDNQGIFTAVDSAVTQIVRTGQQAPDGDAVFGDFENGAPVLNSNGQVAFYAELQGNDTQTADYEGIYLGSAAGVSQVVRQGQAEPGGNGDLDQFHREVKLNDAGQVAFRSNLSNTSGGSDDDRGLFVSTDGVLQQYAREGQSAPDGNGKFSTMILDSINNSGEILFMALLSGTSGGASDNLGLFIANGIDVLQVARRGDVLAGGTITSLTTSRLNEQTELAYHAVLNAGGEVIARYSPDRIIHWDGTASGSWQAGHNWLGNQVPNSFHHAIIDPAAGTTVTGPGDPLTVDSLRLGAQSSGVAELVLQNELQALRGEITIEDRGRLTLSGQTVDKVHVPGGGEIAGHGLALGVVSPDVTVLGSGAGFRHDGPLDLGTQDAVVASLGFANLGSHTSLDGGTIFVPGGLFVEGASYLTGNGAVSGRIAGQLGSTIVAQGDLSLGDASSLAGFVSDGELYTNENEVVINDANEAVLGSLTSLGDGSNGGMLTAGAATIADLQPHFLLEEGKNLVGRGMVHGNFKNLGHIIGDGTAAGERIVFESDWVINGKGTFSNTLVLGTFAPGESPGVTVGTNQAFGGTVEFELGGVDPGNGPDNYDQINDSGMIMLVGEPTIEVLAFDDFLPEIGDEFVIMTWQSGLDGSFGDLQVDPFFTGQGIMFDALYNDVGGAGNLTLAAVAAVPEPSSIVLLGLLSTVVFASRRTGLALAHSK